MSPQKLFFNSSLPRSGSTLMQNILAQNPRFYCSPTSGVFELLFVARDGFNSMPQFKAQDQDEMKKGFYGFCEQGLRGFYQAITDRPVCIDKSRGWVYYYDWLNGFIPNPKIIVCIRDLRAIVSSMEKLFLKNPHVVDRDDNQLKMNMITKRNRVIHWLNSVPVGISVTRLLDAVERGNAKYFHIVRFEDLTSNPRETMNKVYDYLEEPHFEHDFNNVEQITEEDDTQYPIYGDHKIRQQIKPVPLDYFEVIGKELSETIRRDNPVFYNTFYPGKI
jgi:sulfotransferase